MIELFGTLGPACQDEDILYEMFQAGMIGMRLNLSHAGLNESAAMIEQFHRAASRADKKAELLIDLQGPELRVGTFSSPLILQEGSRISIESLKLPTEVIRCLTEKDDVLLDDGKLLLRYEDHAFTVIHGGTLSSRKSIKIVGTSVPMPALTETDRNNLASAKAYGVTAVMQPFVRNADDIHQVRAQLEEVQAGDIRIFSKIENREGLEHLDEIIACSDMIVIARGDLGNDVPLSELPGIQKDIARSCLNAGIPFLVVTQMLTSMILQPTPTRAEVSDIFNAVLDGASAVMVTNETAVGTYPVNVIQVLHDTVNAAIRWKTTSL
ncbi:MAG: pyruvate kinase [Solobacterium sp.]|nr:pyruvate kinase [Solobacterium sp.]